VTSATGVSSAERATVLTELQASRDLLADGLALLDSGELSDDELHRMRQLVVDAANVVAFWEEQELRTRGPIS
jgi:hypothetical protein